MSDDSRIIATVRLETNGSLVVLSKGETMRVVATRPRLAAAAGQRVAELVEEALQARESRA